MDQEARIRRTGSPLSRRALIGGAAGAGPLALGTGSVIALWRDSHLHADQPRIFDTQEWGAAPADSRLTTLPYRPTQLVIHHTDTANVWAATQSSAFALARKIQTWHMQQDWGDSGQHFTISRGGFILEGRHGSLAAAIGGKKFVQGAHARGSNRTSIGIENEGTYNRQLPPDAQRRALVQLAAWLCDQYKIPVSGIIGHRDTQGADTDCPGEGFYRDLPRLRAEVTKAQNTPR